MWAMLLLLLLDILRPAANLESHVALEQYITKPVLYSTYDTAPPNECST